MHARTPTASLARARRHHAACDEGRRRRRRRGRDPVTEDVCGRGAEAGETGPRLARGGECEDEEEQDEGRAEDAERAPRRGESRAPITLLPRRLGERTARVRGSGEVVVRAEPFEDPPSAGLGEEVGAVERGGDVARARRAEHARALVLRAQPTQQERAEPGLAHNGVGIVAREVDAQRKRAVQEPHVVGVTVGDAAVAQHRDEELERAGSRHHRTERARVRARRDLAEHPADLVEGEAAGRHDFGGAEAYECVGELAEVGSRGVRARLELGKPAMRRAQVLRRRGRRHRAGSVCAERIDGTSASGCVAQVEWAARGGQRRAAGMRTVRRRRVLCDGRHKLLATPVEPATRAASTARGR
mmetsp:Transcript_9378/g.24258  ORF Transcript_9378/g.24258 Transcript_9378/m.24258 type:complete len:359 (+) Transcript_9378:303-1379(+)